MKTWGAVVKVFVALLAIAGAIVVVAKYGDKIVAWCKKIFKKNKPLKMITVVSDDEDDDLDANETDFE